MARIGKIKAVPVSVLFLVFSLSGLAPAEQDKGKIKIQGEFLMLRLVKSHGSRNNLRNR